MFDLKLFSFSDGNMLIQLLIAHFLADFIFQSGKMVKNKKWYSKEMFGHIFIVYFLSLIFSGWYLWSLIIAASHYLIDGIKMELDKRNRLPKPFLFVADQLMHCLIIIIVWAFHLGLLKPLKEVVLIPFQNYKISLILLSYLIITTPIGYLVGLATQKLNVNNHSQTAQTATDNNGLLIGIFERIIILTFVFLNQYEAIGFLITGKSIIRFSSNNEDIKSEYVLLGTMMSYGITICFGVIIKTLFLQ